MDDADLLEIKEGKATILVSKDNEVFYNKVQELNRDLTVTVLTAFAKHIHSTDPKIRQYRNSANGRGNCGDANNDNVSDKYPGLNILEALGATGLRSIRFSKELDTLVNCITCNDMSEEAVSAMKRNFEHNNCLNILPSLSDACLLMMQHKKAFDVVDIDPYGTPSIFLDSAVQSVRSGGLLCVTATDLAVLAGNHIQACYGKYGSIPLKRVYNHEFALRILLSCIDTHANRHGRYIKPLFSYKSDFYVRVFVQVIQSQSEVQKTSSRRSYVYDCVGCHSFYLQKLGNHTPGTQHVTPGRGPPVTPECSQCGKDFYIGGPIWSDKMHDSEFLQHMLNHISSEGQYLGTKKRMTGLLIVAQEELDDCPLFYELSMLSKTIHTTCPPLTTFRSALLNAGYRVSLSHVCPKSVKTNAPPSLIWDIMRCWGKLNHVKVREPETVAGAILRIEPSTGVDFTLHPEASLDKNVHRFPPNPEPNWGPKGRAGKRKPDSDCEKSGDEKPPRKNAKKNSGDLKKFSCKRFEMNQCDLGEKCRYSHSVKEDMNGIENSTTIQNEHGPTVL